MAPVPTTLRVLTVATLLSGLAAGGALAQGKVLKTVPEGDLKVLDPIVTTASISQAHALSVFDTLFALDEKYRPQPQMVDTWTVSPDGLVYRFTLRAGLKFHDGRPVTTADVIQSITRWAARDSNGTILRGLGMQLAAVDDRSFTLTLKEPWGLVLDSLAKEIGRAHV